MCVLPNTMYAVDKALWLVVLSSFMARGTGHQPSDSLSPSLATSSSIFPSSLNRSKHLFCSLRSTESKEILIMADGAGGGAADGGSGRVLREHDQRSDVHNQQLPLMKSECEKDTTEALLVRAGHGGDRIETETDLPSGETIEKRGFARPSQPPPAPPAPQPHGSPCSDESRKVNEVDMHQGGGHGNELEYSEEEDAQAPVTQPPHSDTHTHIKTDNSPVRESAFDSQRLAELRQFASGAAAEARPLHMSALGTTSKTSKTAPFASELVLLHW